MKPVKSTLTNMILALLTVSACSALLLGAVYYRTKEPIALAKNEKTLESLKEIISDFDNNPLTEKTLVSTPDNKEKLEFYPARKNGMIKYIAIKTFSNNGFGGKIELIVVLTMDGTVIGYKIIEHKETPGLGTKITKPHFSDQFIGLNAYFHKFKLSKNGGEIDAVSGATISSRAVTEAINKAVSTYRKFNIGANSHVN